MPETTVLPETTETMAAQVTTTATTAQEMTTQAMATMTDTTTAPIPTMAAPAPSAEPFPAEPARPPRSRFRALPARWRITAWIIASTVVTLLAVGLIGRSIFLADIERSANADVEQEAQEFHRFLAQSASDFTSADELLADYLGRQSVHAGEIIVGAVDGKPVALANGLVEGESSLGFPGSDALALRLLSSQEKSGNVSSSEAGPLRWGRVDFASGDTEGSLLVMQFTQAQSAAVDQSVVTIAWVAFAGLLLSSGVAWLVAGQILAPVREVHRVAREISEHDLTARVPVEGNDDIAAVATTFNQMLDRLEGVYATQQRFVDDAGHELRTPITIVRGHLELLSDDPVERRETLRLVSGELDRMSRIVTDLLVLARAEQPDFVRVAGCDIASLTLDIEAKAQALGDRRWQLMEVAEGRARLDPQRITQAVLQLAANAVQITEPGARIRIGSRFEGAGPERMLRLWVQDEGPGVAPADAERIFERFVRGGASGEGTAPRRGSGLGLAIVRAITDAHGGSAWVDSVLGEGATFGLDIPAPNDADPVIPLDSTLVKEA
ncbi:sensor histidine kinase [Microbacterium sp. M]|uniref:sensor histidine kinase n=1 Tax=Microbacterium sp. M TaxID=3377125 RepID=UPI0038675F95